MKKIISAILTLIFLSSSVYAQGSRQIQSSDITTALGYTPAQTGGVNGQLQYNNAGSLAGLTISGDATLVTSTGVLTFNSVNSNVGTWGGATFCSAFNVNAKGLITAAAQSACTPAISNVTGLGSGVSTALAVNVGTVGAFVTNGGVLGTPLTANLTNATGLPVATGISGLGTGIATWLSIASSANLRSAVTDETGSGLLYFQNGDIGTPSAGVATNLTGTAAGLTAGNFSAGSASNLSSGTLLPARTNGHMNGTATNDSAATGEIGEFASASGSPALTTNVPINIASISLTAGDWDIYGTGIFNGAGATVTSDIRLGINTVSNTLPSASAFQFFEFRNAAGITDFFYAPTVGPFRVSLSSTTTYYLVAQATFTTSTFAVSTGGIRARRVR